jgi:hypothetical protein
MADRSVVIIGLPESGKTTFLAALWHLITDRTLPTVLSFRDLLSGDVAHLNAITARWRDARVQERTAVGGNKLVSMNLKDASGEPVRITFPDVAGEAYRRMWEDRSCDQDVSDILRSGGVLLFIHADTIRPPQWTVDEIALSKKLGLSVPPGGEVPWHPRLAPTQVQIVGLLQLMRQAPLDVGPRKLAVMLSAWDKVSAEGMQPAAFVKAKMPLLSQYLRQNADSWDSRVYGLSAQGGDYDDTKEGAKPNAEAQTLRELDQPSKRIRLVEKRIVTQDLTEPLAWLMDASASGN